MHKLLERPIIKVFHEWHFVEIKKCNTSTHPSRVYINQIQKNFFPMTSQEGQTTKSKMRGFYIVDFHSALTWSGWEQALFYFVSFMKYPIKYTLYNTLYIRGAIKKLFFLL